MKCIRVHIGLSVVLLLSAASVWAEFDWDPIYESMSATNGMEFVAVRPFYSQVEDPATERWQKEYLWPFYTKKGFKDETYSRFLFFGWSQDFSEDDDRHRNWVIPFYFQGVDANGEGCSTPPFAGSATGVPPGSTRSGIPPVRSAPRHSARAPPFPPASPAAHSGRNLHLLSPWESTRGSSAT